jgi:hypothetical protein
MADRSSYTSSDVPQTGGLLSCQPSAAQSSAPQPGCGAEWLDLLHTGEKLLLAGLRREIGPDGDLRAAYRSWYREQMDEHDRLVALTYDRLHAALAESGHAI